MTAAMAGEEQLVFHDFLGIACHRGDLVKRSELEVVDASVKSQNNNRAVEGERVELVAKTASMSSGHFDDCCPSVVVSEQLSWPQGSGAQQASQHVLYNPDLNNRQGKRRDVTNSGDFLSQLQASPYLKVSRFERLDDRKSRHIDAGRDFMQSPMQPPRVSSKFQNPHPSFVVKPGASTVISNKWDNAKQHVSLNAGMFGPAQMSHLNLQADKVGFNNIRESGAVLPRPPADEGSRTGLKGSNAGVALNSIPADPVPASPHTNISSKRSKSWSQSAGSESMYVASQQTKMPTSRQLTIFYGGQAHVFDDVPSDKADAIMTLAGSSGRSWSTMYTPRPKANIPASGSEGPLSMVDREREKSISKSSAMDSPGLNLPEGSHAATSTRQGDSRSGHKIAPVDHSEGLAVPFIAESRLPLLHSISAAEIRKEAGLLTE